MSEFLELRKKIMKCLSIEDAEKLKKELEDTISIECKRCGKKKTEISRYSTKICRDCEIALR